MATNKNNTGAIFKNTEKKTAKHPDYTGICLVSGEDYRIAGWIKEGKKGKYLSLAFTAREDDKRRNTPDDIPF